MTRIALLLMSLCLSLPALAEQKQSYGDLDVHYSAFNSGFLQPEVAAATGLVRSKTQGVVNVAVLKAGTASSAKVSGTVKNLLGQSTALSFKEVKEGKAIYYLAQFPFEQRETLRFTLNLTAADGVPHSFDFNQEFFPDE
ncbi:MAG: homoserine acetyltransferase [Pseudomonas sp. PGPPP3]|nr:MAG: homoserine acetyltransferase [Pseudomonas sp. PGPPP3]